jgi:hypothetical protein
MAINLVGLMNVVRRFAPFNCAIEDSVKPEPVSINRNRPPPASTELGEMLVSIKAGTGAAVIIKGRAFDCPPFVPPLVTVTLAVPACARSEAGMAAVS